MKRDHENPSPAVPIHRIMNGSGSDNGIVADATESPSAANRLGAPGASSYVGAACPVLADTLNVHHNAAIQM